MQTISINDSNDIYLTSSGNLAIDTDINAMGDIFVNKSQTRKGELLYDTEKGIDFFNTIFNSPSYPELFQNEVITQLEDTQATQKITSYESEQNNNVYSYTVKIQTDYGEIALNG